MARKSGEVSVPNYRTIDKTDWFIRKMTSGWFSRREIVQLAAAEFPDISEKTLDGTIGQYWSDSVNPKWSTSRAILVRGLRVVESAGRRRIVGGGSLPVLEPTLTKSESSPYEPPQDFNQRCRPDDGIPNKTAETQRLWSSNDPQLWKRALDHYWSFVRPANLALEKEVDQLDSEIVRAMDPHDWYEFLMEKYFRWKYTAPNRYASTTKILRSYAAENQLALLCAIKNRLFAMDKNNVQQCLAVACSIRGLGTAGASGLLAVLFPAHFGTVDQFVVKALLQIPDLKERDVITSMRPEALSINEGAVLIRIMRRRATELNAALTTSEWTPRKVDMVLWTCGR